MTFRAIPEVDRQRHTAKPPRNENPFCNIRLAAIPEMAATVTARSRVSIFPNLRLITFDDAQLP